MSQDTDGWSASLMGIIAWVSWIFIRHVVRLVMGPAADTASRQHRSSSIRDGNGVNRSCDMVSGNMNRGGSSSSGSRNNKGSASLWSATESRVTDPGAKKYISLHLGEGEELIQASAMPRRMVGEGGGGPRWTLDYLASESEGGIAEVIAAGSFAQVATVDLNGTKLAVKEMPSWHPSLEDETETFVARELRLLEACSVHPNVVDMFGVLMLMPCATTSIGAMIDVEPLSEGASRSFIGQLLSALEFLHEQGIAHRDIKPANLLVTEDSLMVADFGIAEQIPRGGFFHEAFGTKSYMAPEVLKSGVPYDLKVDLWATGVVAHEMLTRSTPFRPGRAGGQHTEALDVKEVANICAGMATFEAALRGTSALDFMSKLLVVDASKRLSAAQAAEHPWLGCSEDVAATRARAAEVVSLGQREKEEARMRLFGRRRVVRVRRAVT